MDPQPPTSINGLTGSPTTTFDCSICCESFTDHYISIQGDCVCKTCFNSGIKPQFELALKDESQYPVRWGNAELNILSFMVLFDEDFLFKFLEEEREYRVLPGDRIFCAGGVVTAGDEGETCGIFLGSKFAQAAERGCNACKARTCACCGSLIEGTLAEHECSSAEVDDEEKFKELKRGTDYQKCPGCGGVVQLQDGCNHLVCSIPACRKHFCYICGEEAYDGSGHWDTGKPCPKYNQPGSEHAFFEQPGMGGGGGFGMFGGPGLFNGVPALGAPPNPAFFVGGGPGGFNFPNPGALPPRNPARRNAIAILADRSQTDLLPNAVQPDDAPEVRLRKIDRRELERIIFEAEAIELAGRGPPERPGHVPAPQWILPVMDLAAILSSLVEMYTIHFETNEMARELVEETRRLEDLSITALVDEAGAEAFERFPTLRRIFDTYQIAARGDIAELRRQTRD